MELWLFVCFCRRIAWSSLQYHSFLVIVMSSAAR